MSKVDFNILIGGPAGSGIEKSGKILALSFVRSGYYVYSNVEYMSQIRGGNNFSRIRVKDEPVECHKEEVNIIIALDAVTIVEHAEEITTNGAIIFDKAVVGEIPEETMHVISARGGHLIDVPLRQLASEEVGNSLTANVIGLGVVAGLAELDREIMVSAIDKVFGAKSEEVLKANEKALDLGTTFAKKNWAEKFPYKVPKLGDKKRMFMPGNDALCIGAIKGGCKFVGEYPMTPSSSVLHFMAAWAEEYGIVVKHTEDEIAAVNSLIGAGFAGARAMAATAGGGFALMTEGIGLASMNEVPIVVVNVMRPGPATGQPTRTEQGDLRQVIHAAQGDPVKIVLLPGDPYECFEMGFEAFNLAEKYQLPVIICYDKTLGEGFYTVDKFREDLKIDRGKLLSEVQGEYKRYLLTEDGISPRVVPGVASGIHRATSDEHNEYGDIFEDSSNRKLMMEKRMRKLELAKMDLPKPLLIGDPNAEITFVTWAAGKGVCVEASKELGNANVLQIRCAYPFLSEEVSAALKACKRPILVEQNYTGQMGGLIAEHTGIMLRERILSYNGRPMTAKFIVESLRAQGVSK